MGDSSKAYSPGAVVAGRMCRHPFTTEAPSLGADKSQYVWGEWSDPNAPLENLLPRRSQNAGPPSGQ